MSKPAIGGELSDEDEEAIDELQVMHIVEWSLLCLSAVDLLIHIGVTPFG